MNALSPKAAQMRADAIATLARVPEHLRGGLVRYLDDGVEPGGLLCAVLDNDLRGAIGRTGMGVEFHDLRHLVRMLYSDCPADAQGDRDTRLAWQQAGGLNGQYAPRELVS